MVMENICKTALALIKYRIFGGDYQGESAFDDETLKKIYLLSRSHDLDNVTGSALCELGVLPEGNARSAFEKSVMTAVFRCENFKAELADICAEFEKAGIDHIPLKGSVLRSYYPEEWLRTSCDIDVLVKESDLESAVNALIGGLSYKLKQRSEHDVSLYSPSGVHVELHYSLFSNEDEQSKKILNLAWETCSPDNSRCKRMASELFYFYHIAHMAKHFKGGGCGLRPFVDIKIMLDKFVFDRAKADELLAEFGLEKFARAAEKLSFVWFDGEAMDQTCGVMQEYILYSGVYGSSQNKVVVNREKKGGKFGYALSRIFLPYATMKKMHPVLEKHKWLLPWFEVRRWFVVVFDGRGKNAIKELSYNGKTGDDEGAEFRKMFKLLDL